MASYTNLPLISLHFWVHKNSPCSGSWGPNEFALILHSNAILQIGSWRQSLQKLPCNLNTVPSSFITLTFCPLNLRATPRVVFAHEPGQDEAALTREFFVVSMQRLRETVDGMVLFEVESGHLVPATPLFVIVGKMIAHSLLHTGVGLCGLSRVIVHCVWNGPCTLGSRKHVCGARRLCSGGHFWAVC